MLASQTCSSPNICSHHFRLTSTCAAPEMRNAKCGEVRVRESIFMYVYKRLPETAVKGLVPGVLPAGLTLSFAEPLRSRSLTLSDFHRQQNGLYCAWTKTSRLPQHPFTPQTNNIASFRKFLLLSRSSVNQHFRFTRLSQVYSSD